MNNKSLFLAVSILAFTQVACAENEKETVAVEKATPAAVTAVEKVEVEAAAGTKAVVEKVAEKKLAEATVVEKPAVKSTVKPKPAPIASGPAFIEGKDYAVIDGTKGINKAQVMEVFSYHCGHCYNMEGFIHNWLPKKSDELEFVQVPLYMGQAPHLAQGYYTGEVLGVLDKVHMDIFNTWHRDKKIIRSKNDLIPIFERAGVSKEDFDKTYNSFAVASKVQYARKVTRDFKVLGVPKFIINQKYEVKEYQQLERLLNVVPFEKAK